MGVVFAAAGLLLIFLFHSTLLFAAAFAIVDPIISSQQKQVQQQHIDAINQPLSATTSKTTMTGGTETTITPLPQKNNDKDDEDDAIALKLLPLVQSTFSQSVISVKIIKTIVQSNAKGYILETNNAENDGHHYLFLKTVYAPDYKHKPWTDLRRTLLYLRTEVRFYRDILPQLQRQLEQQQQNSSGQETTKLSPTFYGGSCNLEGLIDEKDWAVNVTEIDPLQNVDDRDAVLDKAGGYFILESLFRPSSEDDDSLSYFQASPLSVSQMEQCLRHMALFHASAWQQQDLLKLAQESLSRGSYHLQMRASKEMARMHEAWDLFQKAFYHHDKELFDSTPHLGRRIAAVASDISKELSPHWNDNHATLVHGDLKAMNIFLPSNQNDAPLLIDFASTGVGMAMSDISFIIFHALAPKDIDVDKLLNIYVTELNLQLKTLHSDNAPTFSVDLARRHFRLGVLDYFRFFLGRMWYFANPENMEKRSTNPNINMINRYPDAALNFVKVVNEYLTQYEQEMATSTNGETEQKNDEL